jgi:hypothetical protein
LLSEFWAAPDVALIIEPVSPLKHDRGAMMRPTGRRAKQ